MEIPCDKAEPCTKNGNTTPEATKDGKKNEIKKDQQGNEDKSEMS